MDREYIYLFTSLKELKTSGNWYAMWINPETINIPWEYQANQVMTQTGYAIYHWRPRLQTVAISGSSGWILRPSLLDQLIANTIKDLKSKSINKWGGSSFWGNFSKFGRDYFNMLKGGGLISDYDLSPRSFIDNLYRVLTEPMWYQDFDGNEYYNTKYLHIFTKLYPRGMILEGYTQGVRVNEQAKDSQMIKYSFDFVVEKKTKNTGENVEEFLRNFTKTAETLYETGKDTYNWIKKKIG